MIEHCDEGRDGRSRNGIAVILIVHCCMTGEYEVLCGLSLIKRIVRKRQANRFHDGREDDLWSHAQDSQTTDDRFIVVAQSVTVGWIGDAAAAGIS